ncbi:MAG: phage major capsid protein [Ignavibacteria bacterium]|nr:phage major capsid protein [Ignavibacteria bacterium]
MKLKQYAWVFGMLAVFVFLVIPLDFSFAGSIGIIALANIGVVGVVKDEETLDTENSAGEVKLTMKDFAKVIGETVNTALKEYTDKVDRKYMKLPESEISEAEKQGKSQRQVDNLKFRKFLKNVVFTKALNTEGTDSQGGYLVPDEYEMEVIKLLNDYGLFRQKCRVKTMGGKTFKQPKLLTGVTATSTNEAATATESNPTFSQIVWTAKKLDVVTGLSQELYDDEEVDIISELAEITASAMSQKEDAQGFLGTGSPITGAFSAGSINSVILSGQNPNTMTWAKLISMMTAVRSVGLKKFGNSDPQWYMHRAILNIIISLVDTQGRPMFDTDRVWKTKEVLGYKFNLSEELNDGTASASRPILLFGNLWWSVLRERKGMLMRMSDSAVVGGNSAFEKDLLFVKTSERFDIQHLMGMLMLKW